MSKKQPSTRNQEGETIPHAQRNRRAWVVVSYDIPVLKIARFDVKIARLF